MTDHVFTGFGFGPIQSGIFASEAFQSSNFKRIVIAEIDQALVDAIRANKGTYYLNVAKADGIEVVKIDNIEILNPTVNEDRKVLIEALSESTEIATSLPSVDFFDMGKNSVASLIAKGLENSTAPATILYAAENNNHAAEILCDVVTGKCQKPLSPKVQFLNTVIGKMSRVVTDPAEIELMNLTPMAPGIERAFLVEQFNRILVTKCAIEGFTPGIDVLAEKSDLMPFEEAKLYGHNAIHALLAYLGIAKGCKKMTQLKDDPDLMNIARHAFITESGDALIKKYSYLGDPLFSAEGYREYAEDLLVRMTNPYLEDTTARAARDPRRKLAYNDRIFGTMDLAAHYGIDAENMAMGAAAGLRHLLADPENNQIPEDIRCSDARDLSAERIEKILIWLWNDNAGDHAAKLIDLVQQAMPKLAALLTK